MSTYPAHETEQEQLQRISDQRASALSRALEQRDTCAGVLRNIVLDHENGVSDPKFWIYMAKKALGELK